MVSHSRQAVRIQEWMLSPPRSLTIVGPHALTMVGNALLLAELDPPEKYLPGFGG